jgi:hypothetical protein
MVTTFLDTLTHFTAEEQLSAQRFAGGSVPIAPGRLKIASSVP